MLLTQPTLPAGPSQLPDRVHFGTPHASISPQTATLERDFFAALREGDAKKFLSYVPEGRSLLASSQAVSRTEVEEQLSHHRGLYCKLFDSSCIDAPIKLDASSRTCSDRELLDTFGKGPPRR